MRLKRALTAFFVLVLIFQAGSAQADMVLTTTAQNDGFKLTTFASGFPSFPAGEGQNGKPFGIAFASNGTVLVSDLNGNIYNFASDTDNRTVAGATVGATYGSYDPLGMTQSGNNTYLGFQSSNVVDRVSNLYVNTNCGELVQINVATDVQTIIGTGGSRRNVVSVDPNNGTLLLDQTDTILRLTAPPGGGFGTVPEPSSLCLLGIGVAGVTVHRWRRSRRVGRANRRA